MSERERPDGAEFVAEESAVALAEIPVVQEDLSESAILESKTVSTESSTEAEGVSERTLQLRSEILNGPYGTVPIAELIQDFVDTPGGPEIQAILQALATRKDEALYLVKETLRSGDAYEKHMITKLLRYSPWPEAYAELLAIACDPQENWLPRQGALYALGALGNSVAGPELVKILEEPDCPSGVQLVAISTMARVGYEEAVDAIRPFVDHQDVHIRLFASRALAELGEPIDRSFLLSLLQNPDYLVRQETCEVLAAADFSDMRDRLVNIAENDNNESVRLAATHALLRQEIDDQDAQRKLDILQQAFEGADRRSEQWLVQTILAQCGKEGRAFVEELSESDDRIGERARMLLVMTPE